ncbi:hypothetical protein [Kibdelosporangium aridum]|uniref:hypothetical protein n=1 Tax=Kibdelosporangium aridum TaxID=2030 RepID=UPI0035EDB2F6
MDGAVLDESVQADGEVVAVEVDERWVLVLATIVTATHNTTSTVMVLSKRRGE